MTSTGRPLRNVFDWFGSWEHGRMVDLPWPEGCQQEEDAAGYLPGTQVALGLSNDAMRSLAEGASLQGERESSGNRGRQKQAALNMSTRVDVT